MDELLRKAAELLKHRTPAFDTAELGAFAQKYFDRRQEFITAATQFGTPLYLIDEDALRERAAHFTRAFRAELPDVQVYYAIKTNNHPAIANIMVRAGLGLDVSSGLELELALRAGASDIVFSGPAKMESELALAAGHPDRVTVLMDSFRELELLQNVAEKKNTAVRAGVRLTTDERGLWRKFGISLESLGKFFEAAESHPRVILRGIQFHTSWNLEPSNQVNVLARLGQALARMDARHRAKIEFIDIGGGFWPEHGEWIQPIATPEGKLREAITGAAEPSLVHHRLPAMRIEEFAHQIAAAVHENIFPHVRCRVCAEPGRWIVHDGLHIMLSVLDRKEPDIAITDGATNAIGWERFETDYFPVLNLSRPSLNERLFYVLGSLCTPHDVWGYSFFGEDVRPGDVLLIPTQGAYTYSLRQNFIKPLPKSVLLSRGGAVLVDG